MPLSLPALGTLLRVERDPGAQALPWSLGIAGTWFLSHLWTPTHWTSARSLPPTPTQALWALGKEEEGGGPGPLLCLAWLNYQQDLEAL